MTILRAKPRRMFRPRTPKAAERVTALLGDMAGAVVQSVEDDQNGWDCMLEFPPIEGSDLPPDLAPPGLTAMVQVKSSESAGKTTRISLSNALKYARHPLPYFIILVTTENGPDHPTIYVKHVWRPLLEDILKASRKAHIEGRPLHKVSMSVRFKNTERHDKEAIQQIANLLDSLGPNYASQKEKIIDEAGYEEGYGTGKLVFEGMDTEKFVDLMLGLGGEVDLKRFTFHAARFGMPDPIPEFDGEGKISIQPQPAGECTVTFTDSTGEKEINLDGQIFVPGIPGLPQEYWKLRVKTGLIDISIRPGKPSSINSTLDMDELLTLERLYQTVAFRSWAARGQFDMKIWAKGQLLTSGTMSLDAADNGPYWSRLERVLSFMTSLAPVERRPKDMIFSLAQVVENLQLLEEFQSAIEGETLSVNGDLTVDQQSVQVGSRLVMPAWLEFEGYLFFSVIDRPVLSCEQHGDKSHFSLGSQGRIRGAILKGTAADHQAFIDSESRVAPAHIAKSRGQ